MKILLCAFGLLTFGLSIESCSKKSDPEPVQSAKTNFVAASAWTYQDAGIDLNRDGTVDAGSSLSVLLPSLVPPCRTDNTLLFKKDNTGTTDEGGSKCNSADLQTTAFSWAFVENETSLTMSNNSFALLNGKSKIVALTATSFSLTRDTVVGGTTLPLLVILKH